MQEVKATVGKNNALGVAFPRSKPQNGFFQR
jgi:hypothetical protein